MWGILGAMGARRITSGNDYDGLCNFRPSNDCCFVYIARKIRRPLYLDIRDIFVDTIGTFSWKSRTDIVAIFFTV